MAASAYTTLVTNLGKQYRHRNTMNGKTVYAFLYKTASIAAGTIDATTLIATIEATGTGLSRQAEVLGDADTTGVFVIPSSVWTSTNTDWPSDIAGVGYASASSGGIAIQLFDHMRVCHTTSGSAVVALVSGTTTGLYAGMPIRGVGIQASTTILTVDNSTQFTMDKTASATTNPINLVFLVDLHVVGARFTVPAVNGFEANPWEI